MMAHNIGLKHPADADWLVRLVGLVFLTAMAIYFVLGFLALLFDWSIVS